MPAIKILVAVWILAMLIATFQKSKTNNNECYSRRKNNNRK